MRGSRGAGAEVLFNRRMCSGLGAAHSCSPSGKTKSVLLALGNNCDSIHLKTRVGQKSGDYDGGAGRRSGLEQIFANRSVNRIVILVGKKGRDAHQVFQGSTNLGKA